MSRESRMSFAARPALPSHLRAGSTSSAAYGASASSSTAASAGGAGASPLLLQRIADKKAELASLKELQALSAGLADQMQQLEDRLGTLADGTEAVAAVLSNWHNVLRAINMASMALPKPKDAVGAGDGDGDGDGQTNVTADDTPLPVTLVRIPTEQAALIPRAAAPPGPRPAD